MESLEIDFQKGKTETPWVKTLHNYVNVTMLFKHNGGGRVIVKKSDGQYKETILSDSLIHGFNNYSKSFYIDKNFKYIRIVYLNSSSSIQKVILNYDFGRFPYDTKFMTCLSRCMSVLLNNTKKWQYIKGCSGMLKSIHMKNSTKYDIIIIGYDTNVNLSIANKLFEFHLDKGSTEVWNPYLDFVNGLQIHYKNLQKKKNKDDENDDENIIINLSFC